MREKASGRNDVTSGMNHSRLKIASGRMEARDAPSVVVYTQSSDKEPIKELARTRKERE